VILVSVPCCAIPVGRNDVHCSCLGMFHYGLMIEDGILIFLYAFGAFLYVLYVVLYLLVARPKVLPHHSAFWTL